MSAIAEPRRRGHWNTAERDLQRDRHERESPPRDRSRQTCQRAAHRDAHESQDDRWEELGKHAKTRLATQPAEFRVITRSCLQNRRDPGPESSEPRSQRERAWRKGRNGTWSILLLLVTRCWSLALAKGIRLRNVCPSVITERFGSRAFRNIREHPDFQFNSVGQRGQRRRGRVAAHAGDRGLGSASSWRPSHASWNMTPGLLYRGAGRGRAVYARDDSEGSNSCGAPPPGLLHSTSVIFGGNWHSFLSAM